MWSRQSWCTKPGHWIRRLNKCLDLCMTWWLYPHRKCHSPQAVPVGTDDDGALSLRERDPGANWLEESLFPRSRFCAVLEGLLSRLPEAAFRRCSVWLCCDLRQWCSEKARSDSLKQRSQAFSTYSEGTYTLLKPCLICFAVSSWCITGGEGERSSELRGKKSRGLTGVRARELFLALTETLSSNTGDSAAVACLAGSGEEASPDARCLTAGWGGERSWWW